MTIFFNQAGDVELFPSGQRLHVDPLTLLQILQLWLSQGKKGGQWWRAAWVPVEVIFGF